EVEVGVALWVRSQRDRDGANEHGIFPDVGGEVGAREDDRSRTVGLCRAVVEAERPRDHARVESVFDGDLALDHRLRSEESILVVLDGDAGEILAAGAEGREVTRGAE